jgi:type II secretory pathway pseudopilin PulG
MIMSGWMRRLVNERGFTMVEGVVSIVLLSITVIGVYNIVISANRFVVDARRVTEATNFARMKLEEIADTAGADFTEIPSAGTYRREDDDDFYYIDLPNPKWEVQYSGTDPLAIHLTVSWQESGAKSRERSVQLSTTVTEGRM